MLQPQQQHSPQKTSLCKLLQGRNLSQWAQPWRCSSASPVSASQPMECTENMASPPVTTVPANQSRFMAWPLAQLVTLERSKSSSIKFCQFNTPS